MSTDLVPMQSREVVRKPQNDVVDIVQHLGEFWDLGKLLIDSGMIPKSVKTPGAAVAIILKGRELGLGPMASFDLITVIQGKPGVSPQGMLALINQSGLSENIKIWDDGEAAYCTMKRKGQEPHTERFGMDDARLFKTTEWTDGGGKKEIPLAQKHNWLSQPKTMRKWRVVAACSRVVYPDVVAGLYTTEELGANISYTDDGVEVIDGEVIPQPQLAPPPVKTKGLFTKEHITATREFMEWMKQQCDRANAKWKRAWDEKAEAWLADGRDVPTEFPELINSFKARAHMLKWAREAKRIDPSILPEDLKPAQSEAYLALIFHDEDQQGAFIAELRDYLNRLRRLEADAVYRKHPDLAPDGWAEEQAEAAAAKGDAYEGPDEMGIDSSDPAMAGKDS